MSWSEGDTFLVRYESADGVIRGARPTRVVGERNGYLATWLPMGTMCAVPILADGRGLRDSSLAERYTLPRASRIAPWGPDGILMLFPRSPSAHSIWRFPDAWYVNLERAHRWHEHGVDTRDHVLDVVCDRPRQWRWKDENELEQAVAYDVLTRERADEIRADGARVATMIEDWQPPFCDGWEDWRPDPSWPTPELRVDWAE